MDEALRKELSDIQSDIAEMRADIKSTWKRIDEQKALAESVHKLALSMERMHHEQTSQRKDMDAIRTDVNALKEKPAKRWEAVVGALLAAAVSFVAGWFLNK